MANLLSQTEIDTLLSALNRGEIGPDGRTRPARNVSAYDFRRPQVFLRDQLRTLRVIHDNFARTLSYSLASWLRMPVQVKCLSVDQVTYGDYVTSTPDPCTAARIRIQGEGQLLAALHPAIASAVFDRLAGGAGAADGEARPVTEIENVMLEELLTLLVRDLEPAWNRGVKLGFALEGIESSADLAPVALKEEMSAVIALEIAFGPTQGILSLCYPFRLLHLFIGKLSPRKWAEDEVPAQAARERTNMLSAVNHIPLTLAARLGRARLTMRDLLRVKPGDVLVLDQPVSHPVDLNAAGKRCFTGQLGLSGGKLAVLVQQRVDRNGTEE